MSLQPRDCPSVRSPAGWEPQSPGQEQSHLCVPAEGLATASSPAFVDRMEDRMAGLNGMNSRAEASLEGQRPPRGMAVPTSTI